MKRNDIVRRAADGYFYGRVVRVIDSETVMWICCGLHIHITPMSKLVVENDYPGYTETRTFYAKKDKIRLGMTRLNATPTMVLERTYRMPSLRRIKQMASKYHGRNVWKTSLTYEFLSFDSDK